MTLGWGREQWELDLCPTHNAELSSQFDTWTAKARRASGGRSNRARAKSFGTTDANAVREWAKANGYKVGEKGRIAADVRQAYEAANRT